MGLWEEFYEKARSLFTDDTADQETKKCYYELLEIPRNATDSDIKKSYKKLALKWHPDKNPDRKEQCTAFFVILQQAYEVLIDPQERAFYDKHRENIIHGSSPVEKKDTGINVYPFFQKCFNGFEDDDDGFYSVFRQLFDKLAAEEYPYIEEEDRDFPTFGYSNSDYGQVVASFYDVWMSFSTQRSFAWLDKYDLRNAPDRYNLKCMDKENKKLREAGRKQRNDEIRSLVTYVRKRDKRVLVYREQLEERRKVELQRVENERRKTILDNLQRLKEQDVCVDVPEYHLEDLEKIENELDERFGVFHCDEGDESFFCITCEKKFKTSRSFANHQKSNKHKQAVQELKKYMTEEEQELFMDEPDGPEEVVKKTKKTIKDEVVLQDSSVAHESAVSEHEVSTPAEIKSIPKKAKGKSKNKIKKDPTTSTEDMRPTIVSCQICNEEFPSRSKLFVHINEKGHAALKDFSSTKKKRK